MDSHGHVDVFRALDEDKMVGITWRFFFTRDVVKSERSIFDRIDTA